MRAHLAEPHLLWTQARPFLVDGCLGNGRVVGGEGGCWTLRVRGVNGASKSTALPTAHWAPAGARPPPCHCMVLSQPRLKATTLPSHSELESWRSVAPDFLAGVPSRKLAAASLCAVAPGCLVSSRVLGAASLPQAALRAMDSCLWCSPVCGFPGQSGREKQRSCVTALCFPGPSLHFVWGPKMSNTFLKFLFLGSQPRVLLPSWKCCFGFLFVFFFLLV